MPLFQSVPVAQTRQSSFGLNRIAVAAPVELFEVEQVFPLLLLTILQAVRSSVPPIKANTSQLMQPRSTQFTCPQRAVLLFVVFWERLTKGSPMILKPSYVSLKLKMEDRPSTVPTAIFLASFPMILEQLNLENFSILTFIQSSGFLGNFTFGRFFKLTMETVLSADPIRRQGQSILAVWVLRGRVISICGLFPPSSVQNRTKLSNPRLSRQPFSLSQKSPQIGASCHPNRTTSLFQSLMAAISPVASPANRMLFQLISQQRTGCWRNMLQTFSTYVF